MSDVEHELIIDVSETQASARRLGELALRALVALRDAQDVGGAHEGWVDDAIAEVTGELSSLPPHAVDA